MTTPTAAADQAAFLDAIRADVLRAESQYLDASRKVAYLRPTEADRDALLLATSILSGMRHEARGRVRTPLESVDLLGIACACRWCHPTPDEQEQPAMAAVLGITVAEMVRLASETSWSAIRRAIDRRPARRAAR